MAAGLGCLAASEGDEPLRVVFVANQGVLVSTGSTTLLMDALFDTPNPAYAAPTRETLESLEAGAAPYGPVDLVLVTHNHPDHFAPSVVDRFMTANPQARLVAPSDAVEVLRSESGGWEDYQHRVISLDLEVGTSTEQMVDGARVRAVRTLHSGERESPQNLMYLVEADGWVLFHEGDSNHLPETFRTAAAGERPIDLAVVHFWFPFDEEAQSILRDILKPRFVGLGHYPLDPGNFPVEAYGALDPSYVLFRELGQELTIEAAAGSPGGS